MSRVSVVDLPSGEVAVTVSCHLPVDRPSGVSNEPSEATLTDLGPTFAPLPPSGATDAGWPSTGPVYAADTATVDALVVDPLTGIAPFSNCAPSAGESTASVGASSTRNGTVMNTFSVFSDGFIVSGSSALIVNSLRPRRSWTSAVQRPEASADTRYGCSRAASSIVTVALGVDVPASVNSVASSPTSTTAVTGEVTASVGGLANRTSWMPR